MNTSKWLIVIFLVIMAGTTAVAQVEYDRIERKASRFFDNEEWSSANAMYLLMLEQKPRVSQTYANAVVADIMAGDTIQALQLIPRAMEYEVPLDTLLNDVRNTSFSIGRGDLYENYLLRVKTEFPWLSRIADGYLLDYYSFRQNGPELVRYARTMLAGLPDSRKFLRLLAQGCLLTGHNDEALNAWMRVVKQDPRDYETILDIANYYDACGESRQALKWMKKADAIHPTPYVTARIAVLSAVTQ